MSVAEKRARRRTLGRAVGKFFPTYLTHTKGERAGEPFHLYDDQQQFMDEAYRVDDRGRRVYRIVVRGIARGNGKTPEAAGLGLFELMAKRDAPDIFNVAGAKDQAAILTDFARSFVMDGPLEQWLTARAKSIVHKETHGVMRLLASDGRLQHGRSVSAAFFDELHAVTTDAQVELYVALLTALHKRRDAVLYGITTAGFSKATKLGEIYDSVQDLPCEERLPVPGIGPCLRIWRDETNGVLVWWYGPPDDVDPDIVIADERVWAACNPAPFIHLDDLRKQLNAPGLDELDFLRLHCNMWTLSRDTFIPPADWRNTAGADEIPEGASVRVAVDIGMTHDTTAVAWAWKRPDGKVIVRCRVWSANPDHARDPLRRHQFVDGGRMQLVLVEDFIRALARRYRIDELVYDKTYFEGEAQRLQREVGLKAAELYQHGVLPQRAHQAFYILVREHKIIHPDDPVLKTHVANMAAHKTEGGYRVDKLDGDDVMDAGIAMSFAAWRATLAGGGSIYEERDMLVLGDDDEDDDDESEWGDD